MTTSVPSFLLAVKPLSPRFQIDAVHQHDSMQTGSNTHRVPRTRNKTEKLKSICVDKSAARFQLNWIRIVVISDPGNCVKLGNIDAYINVHLNTH